MSLQVDGVWAGGVWASTVWEICVWQEPGCEITAVEPNPAQREPVSGGTGSSWQYHRDKKKRRIMEDDEDFMRIVQEALPEILKRLR